MLTGELMPVQKGPGATVIGATINKSGSFRYKATKVGADTALAQIGKLVQEAQNSKAPAQLLADKAAQWLVIAAIVIGLITFAVWFWLIGQSVLFATTLTITVFVIACIMFVAATSNSDPLPNSRRVSCGYSCEEQCPKMPKNTEVRVAVRRRSIGWGAAVGLVKVQKHVIKHGHKVLVIFEGRDASGKDGTIKSIVEHLSPRETRVVALGKPVPTGTTPPGTFSASCRICPRRRNWCSSIAVGTIERVWNT